MKKYSRKHIGYKSVTNEGYPVEVIDGSDTPGYCSILLDGFPRKVSFAAVKSGSIANPNHKSVCGIGFIGYGKYTAREYMKISKRYRTWADMLGRCYSDNRQKIQPTYKGCIVHPDWHNFQNFAKWFDRNYVDGYHLDKDIKHKGNKVYSSDNCVFVPQKDNSIEAHAKNYVFINPKGEIVHLYNLTSFCRDNDLNTGHMSEVHCCKRQHHKQWRKSL